MAPPDTGAEPPPAQPEVEDAEPTSVFLSKEQVGKDVKPGDELRFTVKDVDPQTGEVEAVPSEAGGEDSAPTEDLGQSPMEKMESMQD
jgi:hypothetical protein